MLPILYSFRRCPYAIRARMTLAYASITVDLREVFLADKPSAMLDISRKGTVPVLELEGSIIDESIEIINWALQQSDPDGWIKAELHNDATQLIAENDKDFKYWLDKYKYWDRFPDRSQHFYRSGAEQFVARLESLLAENNCLLGTQLNVADIAIFPFIRQFAFVDKLWFDSAPYPNVQRWLECLLASSLFVQSMHKQPLWRPGDPCRKFPAPRLAS
ncbi:MAG: glutathione S-transferase [Porticoccaceae bacterium]|nr:glutathione S-transferase [Porticoccaceae bacterium]